MNHQQVKEIVSLHFSCDPVTGEISRKRQSNRRAAGDRIGHLMKNGYLAMTLPTIRVKVYCHHVVYFVHYGIWPPEAGAMIDHIDGNRTNNAISNIRLADACLNGVNSRLPAGASMYMTKKGPRYRAQLMINGVRYERAGFIASEDASQWYLSEKSKRSAEFFGEIVGA